MIGIVILNYNGWDMTIDCIKSIRKSCQYPYKIYIVDNASPIKMTEKFKTFMDQSVDCELILHLVNKGYSAGNNVGIKRALDDKCDYILISNNDVIFKENSIEELSDYLDEHKAYGIAGPKVYCPNGEIQEINMACKMTMSGKYKYILRKTPLRAITRSFVEEFHADKQDLKTPFDVYAVCGCCFMMTRRAAEGLYPMDENTFLYEEENIIGIRMEKLNLKTIYDTNSEVIHLGGASTQKISAFAYGCFVQSEQYYCKEYLKANIFQRFPLYVFRILKYIKLYGFKDLKRNLKRK